MLCSLLAECDLLAAIVLVEAVLNFRVSSVLHFISKVNIMSSTTEEQPVPYSHCRIHPQLLAKWICEHSSHRRPLIC